MTNDEPSNFVEFLADPEMVEYVSEQDVIDVHPEPEPEPGPEPEEEISPVAGVVMVGVDPKTDSITLYLYGDVYTISEDQANVLDAMLAALLEHRSLERRRRTS